MIPGMRILFVGFLGSILLIAPGSRIEAAEIRGEIVDAANGDLLPARLYIRSEVGRYYFAESAAEDGEAVVYDKQNWINKNSIERHTSLSAHPFRAEVPAGEYTLTAERGPEYRSLSMAVVVRDEPVAVRLELDRWIDMARKGWYSGDTHVHRSLAELPTVLLAEDLNVALPLTYWVTRAFQPPSRGDKNSDADQADALIRVDDTHVIYPRNTEYEIFTVNGKRHTLGAVFLLNHQSIFELGAPPVAEIARRGRREGALLDLDKHDWPWSMALIPVMGVDLFELSNNHVWRTAFAFTNWSSPPAAYMGLPLRGRYGPERDWLEFGWRNYYALLNCGFRLRPTAGTASGVHPVPLGFSRVYVHLPEGFQYHAWISGLDRGRSFVTTGPMLEVTLNGQWPGHVFRVSNEDTFSGAATIDVASEHPLETIEVIVNGEVFKRVNPINRRLPNGAFENRAVIDFSPDGSGWLAVRCLETRPNGRFRFAHTGPFHVEISGRPLMPRHEDAAFLIKRVEDELERSRDVLPRAAVQEYEAALAAYEELLAE